MEMNTVATTETAALEASTKEMLNELLTLVKPFLTAAIVIGLVFGLLMLISHWKIFKKAGERGWKCLIPIYSGYITYKIAWKRRWFLAVVVLTILPMILTAVLNDSDTMMMIESLLSAAFAIAVAVIEIICTVQLAKSFRKGGGFAVGLILLPIIFYPILAFGSAKYRTRKHGKKAAPAEAA